MKRILVFCLILIAAISYASADMFSFGLSPKVSYEYGESSSETYKGFEIPLTYILPHNGVLVAKSCYFTGKNWNEDSTRESVNFSLGVNGGYRFKVGGGPSYLQVVGGSRFTYKDDPYKGPVYKSNLTLAGSYIYREPTGFLLEFGVEVATLNYDFRGKKISRGCQLSIFTTLGFIF